MGHVKVDVKTLAGKRLTVRAITQPLGSGLRIAPGFIATTTDNATGIETAIEANYSAEHGRYVVTAIANRSTRNDALPDDALRYTPTTPILQAAVPHCIAVQLFDDGRWTTVANLSATEGRIIPPWIAAAVVKRGGGEARMEAIEIIYGAAALAGLPPVVAVQRELDIPHRTASDWIMKARRAGHLTGMNYAVGRQAEG